MLKVIKETFATKCIPGQPLVMGFHVGARGRQPKVRWRQLLNEPRANAQKASPGASQGQRVQPSCFYICKQNRKSSHSSSSPHNVLHEILYLFNMPNNISLHCHNVYGQHVYNRLKPQNPNCGLFCHASETCVHQEIHSCSVIKMLLVDVVCKFKYPMPKERFCSPV